MLSEAPLSASGAPSEVSVANSSNKKPRPFGFGSRANRFQEGSQPPKAVSPSGHWCEVDDFEFRVGPGHYHPKDASELTSNKRPAFGTAAPRYPKGIATPKALSPSGHWCEVDDYHERVGPGHYHVKSAPNLHQRQRPAFGSAALRSPKGIATPKALSPSGHWCEVDDYHERVGPGHYHEKPTPQLTQNKRPAFGSASPRSPKGIATPKALSPSGHWCEVDEYEERVGPGHYHVKPPSQLYQNKRPAFGSAAPRSPKGIVTDKAMSPSGHWCELDDYHARVGPGHYVGKPDLINTKSWTSKAVIQHTTHKYSPAGMRGGHDFKPKERPQTAQ